MQGIRISRVVDLSLASMIFHRISTTNARIAFLSLIRIAFVLLPRVDGGGCRSATFQGVLLGPLEGRNTIRRARRWRLTARSEMEMSCADQFSRAKPNSLVSRKCATRVFVMEVQRKIATRAKLDRRDVESQCFGRSARCCKSLPGRRATVAGIILLHAVIRSSDYEFLLL